MDMIFFSLKSHLVLVLFLDLINWGAYQVEWLLDRTVG